MSRRPDLCRCVDADGGVLVASARCAPSEETVQQGTTNSNYNHVHKEIQVAPM